MSVIHEPQLVNTVGHSAGAIIFGIFLYLLLRDRSGARLRGSWLSVAAAGLAFLWNAGSLAVLIASASNSRAADLLAFFCFAILSLLPAVLLHLSLDRSFVPFISCGYALSLISIGMHLRELFHGGFQYHQQALLLITVGFAVLTGMCVVAIILQEGHGARRAKASRVSGAMCAALFAVSFVHFGSGHPQTAWSSELIFHHAGIPLALFVLLQDYRFVLLDAFVRFLANALLAAIITLALFYPTVHWMLVDQRIPQNPLYQALLLVGFCVLLIGFALLRSQAQQWLTKAVFRRPDLGKEVQKIQSRGVIFSEESEFLPWVYGEVAQFMSADRVEEVSESGFTPILGSMDLLFPVPASDVPGLYDSPAFSWVEAVVPIRFAHGDIRYLLLGRRRGGRRYLSEDLRALSRLGAVILEQVERFRNSEMQRLVSRAELRALQSQINPHFLFNALNTLYGIIPREASGARKTVVHLADIFRYFLQSERTFIRLSEELEIVKAYLDIERLRLGPRLGVDLDVDDSALPVLIPILSIQPLVENAIKHGISGKTGPGLLSLQVKVQDDGLLVTVEDSGVGMGGHIPERAGSNTGVGLSNVRRRLQLCFGPDATLAIKSSPSGTKVQFAIPLAKAVQSV
jgi:two-component system LytT family sensor kinase